LVLLQQEAILTIAEVLAKKKKLAPIDWCLSIDLDWTTLSTFLGGETNSGGKMKETGIIPDWTWSSPNEATANSIGFTGLPGGGSFDNDIFNLVGNTVSGTSLESAKAFASSNYPNDNNCFVIRYKSIKA
jgi:uncharacterized protein (TIGR02145 family)